MFVSRQLSKQVCENRDHPRQEFWMKQLHPRLVFLRNRRQPLEYDPPASQMVERPNRPEELVGLLCHETYRLSGR
jgi:hypothetical protein